MEELNLRELQPYIFLLFGLASILFAVFSKSEKAKLKENGVKAEGIIYALGQSFAGSTNVKNKVTIRFVTSDSQWITGDLDQDFATFFTGQYKEGDAIEVFYDAKDPSTFFVDTKQSEKISRMVFCIIGIALSGYGLYQLFPQ